MPRYVRCNINYSPPCLTVHPPRVSVTYLVYFARNIYIREREFESPREAFVPLKVPRSRKSSTEGDEKLVHAEISASNSRMRWGTLAETRESERCSVLLSKWIENLPCKPGGKLRSSRAPCRHSPSLLPLATFPFLFLAGGSPCRGLDDFRRLRSRRRVASFSSEALSEPAVMKIDKKIVRRESLSRRTKRS